MLHIPTSKKNSYQALFSTEPTRRLERNFKKKDMHMNKRSNYNIKIDEQQEESRQKESLLALVSPKYQQGIF